MICVLSDALVVTQLPPRLLSEYIIKSQMDYRVQNFIALLNGNLDRDLSLQETSHKVNLSPSRIRQLFKHETGLSPLQYLKKLRLNRAKELLHDTSLNLMQIMIHVGINDRSHFERDFKKEFGTTPAKYRAAAFEAFYAVPAKQPMLESAIKQAKRPDESRGLG